MPLEYINYHMSDISTLLTGQTLRNQPRNMFFNYETTIPKGQSLKKEFPSKSTSQKTSWGGRDTEQLAKALQRDAKKELPRSILQKELNSLYQYANINALLKFVFFQIAFGLIFIYFQLMPAKLYIYFNLFLSVTLIPMQGLKIFQQSTINGFFKFLSPLLFGLSFYLTLKFLYKDSFSIDWLLTNVCLIATGYFLLLKKYSAYLDQGVAYDDNLMGTMCLNNLGNILTIWLIAIGNYPKRLIKIIKIAPKLIFPPALLYFCFAIWCHATQTVFIQESLSIELLLLALLTFILFDFVLTFLTVSSSSNIYKLSTVINGVHIFISLLRLDDSNPHSRIGQVCLRNLIAKLQNDETFLQTETPKSFAYNTYADIFHTFASLQFKRLNSQLISLGFEIDSNARIFKSEKTIWQDIFIPLRKWRAILANQLKTLEILRLIELNNLLILTAAKAATNNQVNGRNRLRLKSPVLGMITEVRDKCKDAAKVDCLSSNLAGALNVSVEWLNRLLRQIDSLERVQANLLRR